MARDAQRMNEQIARDAEIARIYAEEELQIMIDRLDRTNETVAKYLQEYQQFATELPIERRIELISDLIQQVFELVEEFKWFPLLQKFPLLLIVPFFDSMLVPHGEGLGTPTESHHIPTSKASQSSHRELPSPSLPPIPTESLPTVIPSDNPPLRQYTRRARIAQSSALPPVANEPSSPIRDDCQGEACLTDSGLAIDQDRENIAKTFTLPSDSTPRVTSLAADEGSMQQKLDELTALCTSLKVVSTASLTIPTASPIFTTAIDSTPYTRRKGKEKMVESDTPK
nr:hypothetical protein [Tanacetum cinerariifolium]